MTTQHDLHLYDTPEEAIQAVASLVTELSAASIREHGRFTIALAGGSTPKPLYELLATPPFAATIGWHLWHIFWGDERCVPPDHPDSNYLMAKEALLNHVPVVMSQVYLIHGEDDPADAAAAYEQTLQHADATQLDLMLLGMGDDGHTGSLFPGTEALNEQKRLVTANWVPHLNVYRITATYPLINAARHVAILATDAGKANAVKRAIQPETKDEAPPIAMVHPKGNDAQWYLTQSAAILLTEEAE